MRLFDLVLMMSLMEDVPRRIYTPQAAFPEDAGAL